MAKRKRLTPAEQNDITSPVPPESQSASLALRPRSAPIAEVAGETSARAALDTLSDEMHRARTEGRMVQQLPLEAIDAGYLIRDRIAATEEEMEALIESLRARGQQTAIEVVALPGERFGLISGWRRLTALTRLRDETGDRRFHAVNAIVRAPESAAEAYLSMVEENEVRVGLSFYERARLAAEAVRIGVHGTVAQAIAGLYVTASASKRSKIASFVVLYDTLGEQLKFGSAIPERLGLALTKALQEDATFAVRLRDALRNRGADTVAQERDTLERALRKAPAPARPPVPKGDEVSPGVFLQVRSGRAILSGPKLDDAKIDALRRWLADRT